MSKFISLISVMLAYANAQTIVYTTGADGSMSAYLIVGNSTSKATTSSSYGSISSSSYSPTSTTFDTFTAITSTRSLALPTQPYTGQAILTGTCNIPQYTALKLTDGGQIEVPLIGCSDDRPECCPSIDLSEPAESTLSSSGSASITWTGVGPQPTPTGIISILSAHPQTVCPKDFIDIDPVCCPSGYTLWGQAILGNTPCASLLSTSYALPTSVLESLTSAVASSVAATMTGSSAAAIASPSVTVIVNQVFALGIPCVDEEEDEKHSLSAGAKGGIGAGVAVGVIAAIAGIWACFALRRKRKSRQMQSTHYSNGQTPIQEAFQVDQKHISAHTTEYGSPSLLSSGFPPHQTASPASAGYAQNSGYGQGFVDGVKAAMSPPMSSPGSPPPTYGHMSRSTSQPPTEVPAHEIVHDTPAELSAYQSDQHNTLHREQ